MNFKLNENRSMLIFFLLIPISLGLLSFLLIKDNNFILNKPSFYPSNFIYYAMWFIFYILMGISSYKIYNSMSYYKTTSLIIYFLNLFFLFLWFLIFYNLQASLFAFVFIIFLDIVVLYMILCFYSISKKASLLQIPYFIWLIFISVLNFSMYFLNR